MKILLMLLICLFLFILSMSILVLLIIYIKYLAEKYRVLTKEEASKYINKTISKEYSLNSVKGGLILEEMLYHFDNGCNTKESLKNVYPLVINKIVYFGKKVR